MTTYIFYKVNNSQGFDRDSFELDTALTTPINFEAYKSVFDRLKKLHKGEWYMKPTIHDIFAATENADTLNDWDDNVEECFDWTPEDRKDIAMLFANELNMGTDQFEKWILDYWCIAVPFSIEEIKEHFM